MTNLRLHRLSQALFSLILHTMFFNQWINLRLEGVSDESLKRKLILTNKFALMLAAVCLFHFFGWTLQGDFFGMLLNFCMVVLYLSIPFLNAKKYFDFSRVLTIVSMNLLLFYIVGMVGKSTDSQVTFFTATGLPLLLFMPREKFKRYACSLCPVILFSILYIYDFKLFTNRFSSIMPYMNITGYLFNFLVLFLTLLHFQSATEAAEQKISILYKESEEQKNFLLAILQNTPMIFFVKDIDLKYKQVNAEFIRKFEIDSKDLYGKTDQELNPMLEQFCSQNDEEVLKTRNSIRFKGSLIQNGKEAHYLFTKFPVFDQKKEPIGICGIAVDITEQVNAERLLEDERSRSIYAAKMAALGEMAGGIAHEINNPLTIITLSSESLLRNLRKGRATELDIEDCLEVIGKTAYRISGIITSLKSFSSQPENNQMMKHDLSGIISNTLQLCHERFRTHGVEFIYRQQDEKVFVNCSPLAISQVLYNLLTNAFDAVSHLPSSWIRLELEKQDNTVQVGVVNSGPEISSSYRDKIFQPFFTTKDIGKGTGLGLSISKGIVENHRGKLYLDNFSAYTRFVVELPVQQ